MSLSDFDFLLSGALGAGRALMANATAQFEGGELTGRVLTRQEVQAMGEILVGGAQEITLRCETAELGALWPEVGLGTALTLTTAGGEAVDYLVRLRHDNPRTGATVLVFELPLQ